MISKLIKFFRGYLLVTLTGTSPERFLNLCRSLDIVIWSLRPAEGGYSFCVSRSAFPVLEPLYRKTGTRLTVQKKVGVPFLLWRYRKHFFFPIGMACAGMLLFIMSQFIWRVEISGNSYYSTQVLLEGLQEEGVGYATWKKGIDCKELQTALRKKYTDITWVSVKIEGTRLYIDLQERLRAGEDSSADGDEASSSETMAETGAADTACDLVASSDGTVASIVTRAGTPLVAAGDEVTAGEVLVSGAIPVQDDSGETVSVHYVCADADVVVHTTLPYEDSFAAQEERKILTGKQKTRLLAEAGGRYFDLLPTREYAHAVVVKTVVPVVVGEDFYLPFSIVREDVLFYEVENHTLTETEISARVEANLDKYCENLRENGIQIVSNSVMIERNGETVRAAGNLDAYVTQKEYTSVSEEPADEPAEEE